MKQNKPLKAYFWTPHQDECEGLAVIAKTNKEARRLGASHWGSEVGFDSPDWFIEQRCRLVKNDCDIEGLDKGVVDGYEGVRRGLYAWIEDDCETCSKYRTLSAYDGKVVCRDCEMKMEVADGKK